MHRPRVKEMLKMFRSDQARAHTARPFFSGRLVWTAGRCVGLSSKVQKIYRVHRVQNLQAILGMLSWQIPISVADDHVIAMSCYVCMYILRNRGCPLSIAKICKSTTPL